MRSAVNTNLSGVKARITNGAGMFKTGTKCKVAKCLVINT
jgi:hypothetical protein